MRPCGLLRQLEKPFTTRRPTSGTRRCCIRLAPIVQYPLLLPPVGVGSVLSTPGGGHPLRSPSCHWLGGPLPRQLPDSPQTPPQAEATEWLPFSHKVLRLVGL